MASKYLQKYPVPESFPDLLHDFAREVLRDQPEDIIEFSYLYFKAIEEDTLDQFNYPKKGKNIPPPREEANNLQEEDEQYEGEEGDQHIELYDENGQP